MTTNLNLIITTDVNLIMTTDLNLITTTDLSLIMTTDFNLIITTDLNPLYLADGNPKSWYQVIKNSTPSFLHDFNLLLEDFQCHFDNLDLKSTAYHKIKVLCQTSSCAAYALHFHELVVYLDWTDKSKITAFKEGLKDQVCNLLIKVHPKPTDFDGFIKICIELDKHHAKSGSMPDTADHFYLNQTYVGNFQTQVAMMPYLD